MYYAASSKFLLPCKARPEFKPEEPEGPMNHRIWSDMCCRTWWRRSISCFNLRLPAGMPHNTGTRPMLDSVCMYLPRSWKQTSEQRHQERSWESKARRMHPLSLFADLSVQLPYWLLLWRVGDDRYCIWGRAIDSIKTRLVSTPNFKWFGTFTVLL